MNRIKCTITTLRMDFAQKKPYSEIRFDRFLEFSVNFNDVCFYVHVGSILPMILPMIMK